MEICKIQILISTSHWYWRCQNLSKRCEVNVEYRRKINQQRN